MKNNDNDKLRSLVARFFDLLDTTNVTDTGKEYKPAYFTCSDTFLLMEMGEVMKSMKEMVKRDIFEVNI